MSDTGPMWLTREEDVVSHLYFAAAEIGSATMEFGSFQVPGSLSFPNPEQGTFSFFTHGEVDISANPIGEGDVVRLLRRTVDLLAQLPYCPAVSEELRSNGRRALQMINRFPVKEAVVEGVVDDSLNPATMRAASD